MQDRNFHLAIFVLFVLLYGSLWHAKAVAEELVYPESAVHENGAKKTSRSTLDSSHEYITYQLDAVARWVDGFFGEQRTDLESAHSFIRVRHNNTWQESDAYNDTITVRAKIRLPKLKERLNLVFSDELEDEEEETSNSIDAIEPVTSGEEEVALQYQATKKKRYELDYRIGFRSGSELRVGARLRREWVNSSRVLTRVTQNIFWQDTRGFGSRSLVDIDYVPSDTQLLRWSNRFDFTEDTLGVPWRSRLLRSTILDEKQGLAYYFQAEGETRPRYLTTRYGPGIVYRVNLFKKWLYFELEPSYSWRRAEIGDSRKGIAAITARIEVVFSESHKQPVYPVN